MSANRVPQTGSDDNLAAGNLSFTEMLSSALKTGNTSGASQMDSVGTLDLSKLTAVTFAAMRLEIGSWQFIAKTKEAVTATCCYTRRQLSWEIAEAGQKNKIELQWDDITSLRTTPMGPATELLEVNVKQAPALYQSAGGDVWQRCHDFTGGEASFLRTQKVLFPTNTVMKLLQDLVVREPRLAKLTHHHSAAPISAPGASVLPGAATSIMPSAPLMGALPGFQSCLPQPPQLPLFSNMYNTASTSFATLKDKPDGLVRNPSNLSNLSCATAQPQLSSECLSSTNSDDSLLGGITSSPCYQSSYSSGYINPFQAPNSPSRASPPALDNSALLEQTAAMMKAATAALQSLQSPASLYHSPQRQQPTQNFQSATSPLQQHCYAPQVQSVFPAMPAVPSRGFVPVQTAPSVASIGMQALEELMMGDSSQDSSPPPASHTLQSVQSAPASFYAQNLNSQPWNSTILPCAPQTSPAKLNFQQEVTAHHSMSQVFDNITQSAERGAPRAATPAKPRALKRSVSDIPVFNCKAAAAAMAAREAAKAVQEAAAAPAVVAFEPEADLADLDLPLIDDCFLTDMGSSGVDGDLASGMCFDGLADFQPSGPGLDRSDSSSNLLAEQMLQFAAEEPTPAAAPKRKGRQSKKLKARGGVAKASAQAQTVRI